MEELPSLLFEDPVNPETFLLARKYANSIQVTVRDQTCQLFEEKLMASLQEELRFVLIFGQNVMQIHRKFQVSNQVMKKLQKAETKLMALDFKEN